MEIKFDEIIEKIMFKEKALSFSAIKEFMKSPQHYYRYVMEKKTTKAMEEGKIFHMAVLEPEKFKKNYWVLDNKEICKTIGGKKPTATKVYKEWLAIELEKHKGKMIEQKLYETFMKMSNYLRINSATKKYMNFLETEKKVEYELEGFNIIGFIDGLCSNYTVDIKKVADANYKKVRWILQDERYAMQGSIYTYPLKLKKHIIIFIDMECNVTVVEVTPETLEIKLEEFKSALNEFRQCAEEDKFMSSYEYYNGGKIRI